MTTEMTIQVQSNLESSKIARATPHFYSLGGSSNLQLHVLLRDSTALPVFPLFLGVIEGLSSDTMCS